ncbi:MAG: DUF4351 domain-containing protein [Magnetococcales bacterium]|nr:DUF4351 domain-containing protein [Magnetococcales bacterium]
MLPKDAIVYSLLDKWIYFIKYAGSLHEVPEKLNTAPFRHAFEMAMVANMTAEELALYDDAGIAIADARGGIELARQEGEQRGEQKILMRQLQRRFGDIPEWANQKIAEAKPASLEAWSLRFVDARSLDDVFAC